MKITPPVAACPRPSVGRTGSARAPLLWITTAAASAALLAGCGGGSGGGYAGFPAAASGAAPETSPAAPAPAPVAAATTVSGTVASGAPFSGAVLTAVDQTGATVCSTTVSTTGTYSCALPPTVKAPIVITARRDDEVLYGVSATTADGTVNVTPLTTIVVARLSPAGDPTKLAGALQVNPDAVTAATIQAQVDQLLALLKPLLDALGTTISPITGAFAADGTGQDRVLDSIAVSVRPDGTAASVEITVRTVPAGGAESPPVVVKFQSSDAVLPILPAVQAAALPPPGLSVAVTDLMSRITACYALPLSQRVNAASDSTAVTGGPADVKAPVCRSLFVGDDPGSYFQSGSKVGRDTSNNGTFAGLFRPGATGVIFDLGRLRYYRPNGDLAITYRTLDTAGNVATDVLVVRDVGGVVKLIGNQLTYSASVRAAIQVRDFVNSPAANYVNVGYDVAVANVLGANGLTIFSKVVVTSPDNKTYTLVPTAGNSSLRFVLPNGVVTGTSIIRLAAEYLDTSIPGNPAAKDTGLVYVSPQFTDAQLGAIDNQGVWKLEFFHVDSSKANVVQTYRTISNAPTIAQARRLPLPELTTAMRAKLIADTANSTRYTFGAPSASNPNVINFSVSGQDAWMVPSGAVAPITLTAFGATATVNNVAGVNFDDQLSVSTSARQGQISCSTATVQDLHCDTSTGVPQYAAGDYYNYLQLSARNADQMESFKGIPLYKIVP
jgi:hypothetical protein